MTIQELLGLGERLKSLMLRIRSMVAISSATIALVLAVGGTVSAHAELVSSNPAADSVLESSPAEVVLVFGEGVDMVPGSIRVVSSAGDGVDIGDIRRSDGDATIAADLPALADGSYVVAWRAVSADSHPISGAFTFSVGATTATQPGLVDELLAESKPSSGAERWLAAGRALSYMGVTASIGVAALLLLLAPALVAARRTRTVLIVCLSIGALGTVVMIAAQASIAVGDMWAWGEVARSSAGRWWFIRLGGIAGAIALVLSGAWGSTRRWWSTALAGMAVALLVVVAAGGHGITGRHVTLGFVATVLHLAAMSMWFGGLVALTVVVPRGRVGEFVSRFSPIALCSVIVLAATGVFNAWRQIGSWDALTDSDYGTWLIVKLIVLGAVLTVAGVSRWLLRQSHEAGDETEHDGSAGAPADRALARTVVAEVAGIVLVFAATAGLVNAAPPHASAVPAVASTTVVQGDRLAQIILDPPVTGGTAMHVYLSSSTGSLDQPTEITVTATLSSQGIGPLTIPVVPAGPGHVSSTDANLPLAGTWTFAVTARYGEFDQVTFTADLDVR